MYLCLYYIYVILSGHTETYVWDVPERAGPNKDETDCLTWAYYSDVDPVKVTFVLIEFDTVKVACTEKIQITSKTLHGKSLK